MPVLLFTVAGALIGHGLFGSLGAGVGLIAGALTGALVDYYLTPPWRR